MTTTTKKDLKRAEELMTVFAQATENRKALQDRIKNEMDAYNKNIKESEAELIEIGERIRDEFNAEGNLMLEHGYLHVANSAVIVKKRNFDLQNFYEAHPELLNIDFKKADVKKAFQDKDLREELSKLGVTIDNEQSLQVIANKKS